MSGKPGVFAPSLVWDSLPELALNVSIIGFHGISSVSLDHLLGLFTSELGHVIYLGSVSELVNLTWPTIWQLVGNLDAMLVCEFSVET